LLAITQAASPLRIALSQSSLFQREAYVTPFDAVRSSGKTFLFAVPVRADVSSLRVVYG